MLGWIAAAVVSFFVLGYLHARLIGWTLAAGALLGWLSALFDFSFYANIFLCGAFAAVALALNVPFIRRALITNRILAVYRKILPDMSQTEKEAIDAGTVWWDGD
ncbi:MAG TPA: acyl-CoA dehydrogenase, partial [Burkholderiales bacterium]|nr:acyl-CoA dehydrogenase [Burkholderiales bacterium]